MSSAAAMPSSPSDHSDDEKGFLEKLIDKIDIFRDTKDALKKLKSDVEEGFFSTIGNWLNSKFSGLFGRSEKLLTAGKGEVSEQIKMKLSSSQLNNARIIESVFKAAGMPNSIIAAAIVNAYAESGLKADAIGDGGNSVGLFQLHIRGGGSGMTVESRKDPKTNAETILNREVLKGSGKKLRARAKAGASITELTAIFANDIERPKDREKAMRHRRALAKKMFG